MNTKFKDSCINCHFLMREDHPDNSSVPYKFDISNEQRLKILSKDFTFLNASDTISCYYGVWGEGSGRLKDDKKFEIIVNTPRRNSCFFWSYRPGMMFPAADILQKREDDRKKASKERKLIIIGLFITGGGLILNLVFEIIKFFSKTRGENIFNY